MVPRMQKTMVTASQIVMPVWYFSHTDVFDEFEIWETFCCNMAFCEDF